jgi:dipeptidyl aminopeptidase/acylaminoacyl peptidase
MKFLKSSLTLCAACALIAGTGAAQEKRAITVDDLLAIRDVSSVDLSPDGAWAVYTVKRNDMDKDKAVTQIWMASIDDGTALPLTGETYSASAPRWSPDGSQLAFLATRDDLDEDATGQVWTLDMRGGEARAYTNVTQGVDSFEWAPDGQRMALLITDESENDIADREAKAKGETPAVHPYVIDRLQFKEDGVGYLDRTYTHLYVISGREEEPVQLTFGQRNDSEPDWSPDGSRIAYISNHTDEPDSNDNTDVFTISASVPADGIPAAPLQVTTNPGTEASPDWSPDGKTLTYTTQIQPELMWYATIHLAVVPADGGPERVLTKALDRNVYEPTFSADGRSIYFLSEDSGTQPVSAYDLKKDSITKVIEGGLAVSSFDEGPKGTMAAVVSTPTLPGDVFFLDRKDKLKPVTHVNEALLDQLTLSEPHFIDFTDPDGETVQEFIYPALGMTDGVAPPAILRIHGGPVAQFDYGFDPFAQIYAANGYTTIMANPRGSSGRGENYAAAIWADWGNRDFADVMAGVDKAVEMGLADEDRLGVGGWSYGGILTNYVITKTGRFKGAVSGASEANYTANYGHDIYQREWVTELGLPWENKAEWDRISPFFQIANVTTPSLFIGGGADWNVPILNSEEMYMALRKRGIETGLVVYPDEDHSIGRPSFVADRYQRYVGWYDNHVKGE